MLLRTLLCCCLFLLPSLSSAAPEPIKLKMNKALCLEGEQAVACARAGVMYDQRKQKKRAFAFYKRACFHKDSPVGMACFLQGLLIRGKAASLPLFQRGCKLKDADACEAAGEHLFLNKATRQQAALWLKKGCVGGVLRSCHFWGRWMQWKKKPRKAVKLWTIACTNKYGPACADLGLWHQKRRQFKKSMTFYRRGCQLRSPKACGLAGELLLKRGHRRVAKQWWKRACSLKWKQACKRYKSLK